MKAVAIYEHGGLDKMIYGDVPTPEPGPGDALVRIRAVGVNHFDHDIREGYSGIDHPKPHVLGVEGVGEVGRKTVRNSLPCSSASFFRPEPVTKPIVQVPFRGYSNAITFVKDSFSFVRKKSVICLM